MKKGFTLIEMIVVISLFSVIMLSGSQLLSSFFRASKVVEKKSEMLQIKQGIITRLTKEIRNADQIKSCSADKLVLANKTDIFEYGMKNNKAYRSKNGALQYLCEPGELRSLGFEEEIKGLIIIKADGYETGVFCRNER